MRRPTAILFLLALVHAGCSRPAPPFSEQNARAHVGLLAGTIGSRPVGTDANARDTQNRDTALRSRTLRNLPMLTGFTGGPTEWRNGSVYNPADGRTYRGTITMTGDNSLNLRGCVVAPLCKTQTWTRIQ